MVPSEIFPTTTLSVSSPTRQSSISRLLDPGHTHPCLPAVLGGSAPQSYTYTAQLPVAGTPLLPSTQVPPPSIDPIPQWHSYAAIRGLFVPTDTGSDPTIDAALRALLTVLTNGSKQNQNPSADRRFQRELNSLNSQIAEAKAVGSNASWESLTERREELHWVMRAIYRPLLAKFHGDETQVSTFLTSMLDPDTIPDKPTAYAAIQAYIHAPPSEPPPTRNLTPFCAFCQISGHTMKHCPDYLASLTRFPPKSAAPKTVPNSSSTTPDIVCFHCNKHGHTRPNCPDLLRTPGGSSTLAASAPLPQ